MIKVEGKGREAAIFSRRGITVRDLEVYSLKALGLFGGPHEVWPPDYDDPNQNDEAAATYAAAMNRLVPGWLDSAESNP